MNKNKKPALIIMAAGLGSRFGGGGLKQVVPVGPSGERIIDYSAYDAVNAGFEHIIFVIKPEMQDVFHDEIGRNIEKYAKVSYVHQVNEALPEGFKNPKGRTKPWGTGHAVLCCKEALDGAPFAVLNADDFYGETCFSLIHNFLVKADKREEKITIVCYELGNTMSKNGSVSRGVCEVEDNHLVAITEHTQIKWIDGEPHYSEDGKNWIYIKKDTPVSMNCFAFSGDMIDVFENEFHRFLSANIDNPKAEFYLPSVVSTMIRQDCSCTKVYKTSDVWQGVTYLEDLDGVKNAIMRLVENGDYPERLWT